MSHSEYGCVGHQHSDRCPWPSSWKVADASRYPSPEELGLQRGVIERGLNHKPQPSELEKLAVLRGEPGMCRKWDYSFSPSMLPSTAHTQWSAYDWISFIGSNWFRKP